MLLTHLTIHRGVRLIDETIQPSQHGAASVDLLALLVSGGKSIRGFLSKKFVGISLNPHKTQGCTG